MDKAKISMSNRLILFLYVLMTLYLLFSLPISCHFAYAEGLSKVSVSQLTCSVLDIETMEYEQNVIFTNTSAYAKNIKVYFNIENSGNVNYYCYGIKKQDSDEIIQERVYDIPEGVTEIIYEVNVSGIYDINCYIYDAENILLSKATQNVKSDLDAPDVFADVNTMTAFQGKDSVFNIVIDISELSDTDVYYSFKYIDEEIDLYPFTKIEGTSKTFSIIKKGTMILTYIDTAGNFARIYHDYDKFDFSPPAKPAITVIADNDTVYSDGFARSYTVTIAYGIDNESGTSAEQNYIINGEVKSYSGSFKLDIAKNYEIKANTKDNVGNISDFVIVEIAGNSFDTYSPIVKNIKIEVDITKEIPIAISFIATDAHSGIDYAKIDGTDILFIQDENNTFRAEFYAYGKTNLVIHIIDKAGNKAINHIALSYFGDTDKSIKLKSYSDLYRSIDFGKYVLAVAENIKKAYENLNISLMTERTENSDFDNIFREIDKLIQGKSNHLYVIETAPIYVSSIITFKVNEKDFDNYKLGDSVKLILNSRTLDNEKDYTKIAGFKKGFAEAFNLTAYYKNEAISKMPNGMCIEMNLPYGYYERSFVLINKTNGEIMDVEIYNNKISFLLKDSGDYVMAISGEKNTLDNNAVKKTIKIFGKKMTYGMFFIVIFGTLGGAGIIIAMLIILKKKNR